MNTIVANVVVLTLIIIALLIVLQGQNKECWRPRQVRSGASHDYGYDYPWHQRVADKGPYDFAAWPYTLFLVRNPQFYGALEQ